MSSYISGFVSGVQQVGSQLTSSLWNSGVSVARSAFNYVTTNPGTTTLVGLAMVGIAVTGTVAYRRLTTIKFDSNTTPESGFDQLVKIDPTRNRLLLKTKVKEFVDAIWPSLKLPKSCDNEKNKRFLAKKLFSLLVDHPTQGQALKKEIFKNVVKNFRAFFKTTQLRIESDISKDKVFQRTFNISGREKITSLKMLADETHNKGSGPVLVSIQLSSGRKIVYKPRSMLNELWICGSNVDSLFRQAGLGTYRVYDKKGQDYGYCDYLENNQTQNTMQSMAELDRYMAKFDLMDLLMTEVGISDLHRDNVVTHRKVPYLIDAEVLAPKKTGTFETGLLTGFSAGCIFDSDSKNQIWFSSTSLDVPIRNAEQYLATALHGRAGRVSEMDSLTVLGPTMLNVVASTADLRPSRSKVVPKRLRAAITRVQKTLYRKKHRLVLIDTQTLNQMIKKDLLVAKVEFIRELTRGLTAWGLSLDPAKLKLIEQKFSQDLKNNDIPVFHYIPSQRAAFYHGIKISK